MGHGNCDEKESFLLHHTIGNQLKKKIINYVHMYIYSV